MNKREGIYSIELTLKIALLLALIAFLLVLTSNALDSCDMCKFDYEGNKIGTNKLMDFFNEKCIKPYDIPNITRAFGNLTILNRSRLESSFSNPQSQTEDTAQLYPS